VVALFEDRRPRVTFIEAPLGWGKTRLVHELYHWLAHEQYVPYWPPDILESQDVHEAADISRQRKRLIPGAFTVSNNAVPEWLWLGVASDASVLARPEEAHREIATQLEQHLYPILRKKQLSRAMIQALRSLASTFVPIPSDLAALLSVAEQGVTFVHEWAGRKKGQRLVSGASLEDSAASLWRLFTSVWGEEGEGGPPVILVLEDCQFLSDATVELLQLILASELPIYVLATGWPLTGDARFASFRRFVESRPPALRVERLQELSIEESEELIRSLHPGTSGQISAVVSRRFGMNPYGLQLFLINHGARRGEAFLWEESESLEEVTSDLHTEMRRILETMESSVRLALCTSALIGYRLPLSVGDKACRAVDPGSRVTDAFETDWVRLDARIEQIFGFIEPIRYEVAKDLAEDRMLVRTRNAVREAAASALSQMLSDGVADPDRDLLNSLYIELGPAITRPTFSLLVECCSDLLKSFWRQRAIRAGVAILSRADALLLEPALPDRLRVALAVQRARYYRLFFSPASTSYPAIVDVAVALTQGMSEDETGLRAWALLEQSRCIGSPDQVGYDFERSRELYTAARASADNLSTVPEDLEHSLRTREYTLMSASGLRREAAQLALAEAARSRTVFGENSVQQLECLSSYAFYLARVSPEQAIEPTRDLIRRRTDVWGTNRHPLIASDAKDLGVRMLYLYRDEMVPPALSMIDGSLRTLEASLGMARETLACRAARSIARRRMAEVAWDQMERSASLHWGELAVEDALETAAGRQRLQTRSTLSVISRQMLGLARAWAGDEAGVQQAAEALAERHDRLHQEESFAEYLWHVRALHEALLRYGRHAEAEHLKKVNPRAFRAPYPND
jgi:hypothetical protein